MQNPTSLLENFLILIDLKRNEKQGKVLKLVIVFYFRTIMRAGIGIYKNDRF